MAHLWLDPLGFVPVAGEFFDGTNAIIYLAEGEQTAAAISGAAMVPYFGSLASGRRAARQVGGELIEDASEVAVDGTVLHRIRKADGTIVNGSKPRSEICSRRDPTH